MTFPGGADNVTLAGTLSQPEGDGPFPAVVLLSGSGPQDRDEALFGHRPFLVLADSLTRRGIAVLRFDDRGVGRSTGSFATATLSDFTADAAAAFGFLTAQPNVDPARCGLVGHSEGAAYAMVLAAGDAASLDDAPPNAVAGPSEPLPHPVAFAVLLAGPGVPMVDVFEDQAATYLRSLDIGDAEADARLAWRTRAHGLLLRIDTPGDAASKAFREYMATLPTNDQEREEYTRWAQTMEQRYQRELLAFDAARYVPHIDVPVLILNGEKDVQVRAEPNLAAFRAAADSTDAGPFTIESLPGLNHLFQTAKTGAVTEYGEIDETFAPAALDRIGDWIIETADKPQES